MYTKGFTITEETLNKNRLGPKERGKILYRRLQELAESGKLSNAKTRSDIASLTGGKYNWVHGMISRGYLKETLAGFTNGTPEYYYSLTDKHPNYTYDNVGRKRSVKNIKEHIEKEAVNPTSITIPTIVQINKDELHITIRNTSIDDVIKIISSLC